MRDEEAAPSVEPHLPLLSGLVQRNARFPNPSVDLEIPWTGSGLQPSEAFAKLCFTGGWGHLSRMDPLKTKQAKEPSFLLAEGAMLLVPTGLRDAQGWAFGFFLGLSPHSRGLSPRRGTEILPPMCAACLSSTDAHARLPLHSSLYIHMSPLRSPAMPGGRTE